MKTESTINKFLTRILFKFSKWIPDKLYISIQNRIMLGKAVDWHNPQLFSDKVQYLKLYNRIPLYTALVDKVVVKEYVAGLIGKQYIIPTLGVYTKAEEIDWNALPEQFVLKCNHDGGSNSVVLCRDKFALDKFAVKKKLNGRLRINNYWHTKEWPYKNIEPCILAEEMLQTSLGVTPKDYKFYCFNGEPKLVLVISGRDTNLQYCYFDMDFNVMPMMDKGMKLPEVKPTKPKNFEKMVELVRKLCVGMPYVRLDLYNIDGNIYFSEYTFYSAGGFELFEPYKWNITLGEWIDITNVR